MTCLRIGGLARALVMAAVLFEFGCDSRDHGPPGFTRNPAEFAEQQRLTVEVKELLESGGYARALPKARRQMILTEKIFGTYHIRHARSLIVVGRINARTGSYKSAHRAYAFSLKILDQVADATNPEIYAVAMMAGRLHLDNRQWGRAIAAFTRAIKWVDGNPGAERARDARARVRKGAALLRRNNPRLNDVPTALKLFDEALSRLAADKGRDASEYSEARHSIVRHLRSRGLDGEANKFAGR